MLGAEEDMASVLVPHLVLRSNPAASVCHGLRK